ncbi:MAG: hypothetical protein F6K35_41410 [Okeania sp. SIO2H7]|nr:hypothetical protein [Okeania sp. SIO2H7]
MANLPDETLTTISNLLPRLFRVINLAAAIEFNLFEQYGETEATMEELEQVNNAKERLRTLYQRLYGLVLQVGESQPVANPATLNLLYRAIEQAEPTAAAVEATALETKRNWNLP